MYDIAIVGAGINGASIAYELQKQGKKVLIFDKKGIAKGGSGAAGAFVSPKFSKVGELKDMLSDAFLYSMKFYEKNFPHLLRKNTLIHIARDASENETLKAYKQTTPLKLLEIENDYENETVCLDTGVVDAMAVCTAMCKGSEFIKEEITSLVFKEDMWIINEVYSAKSVVLANGAYTQLIKEPYLKVRGIWGHRIDVKTDTQNKYILHQEVSISPSRDGILAIGATHDVHFHPDTAKEPYDIQKGRDELLRRASVSIDLKNVEVLQDYTGLRSASADYMPFLGSIVMSQKTMKNKSINFETKKANYEEYDCYPNLYMINGSGGYGFVMAPYLAKILSEHILSTKKISNRISPARFFHRWVKGLSHKQRKEYIGE